MPNPMVALGGGSIVGGLISSRGASRAADAQADAARDSASAQLQATRESNALQEKIYNKNLRLTKPWRQEGRNALGQLADARETMFEGFEESPGYQFRLEQGQEAMERANAARGTRLGGAAMKEAMRYGQGMASDEYGRWYGRQSDQYNRLASLAGVGQSAASQQASLGANYAGAVGGNNMTGAANRGNALMAAGNARASGYQGQANAMTGTLNSLGNIYGMANSGFLGQSPGFGITPMANPFGGM